MANKVLENQQYPAVTKGMIDERIVSNYAVDKTAASYLENLTNDRIGMLTSRKKMRLIVGDTTADSTGWPYSIAFYSPTQNSVPTVVFQNGASYSYTTNYSSVTTFASGLLASERARWDTIGGYLLHVASNGGTGYSLRYFNGTGFTSIAGVAFATGGESYINLISAGFVGRVWFSSDNGSFTSPYKARVYYTDVIPASGDVTALTWSNQYLQINVKNNESITGFYQSQEFLYTFTQNSIFRIRDTESVENSPFANVGAISQEAIVRAKDGVYFYHYSGVYRMRDGGAPEEISRPIYPIIQRLGTGQGMSGISTGTQTVTGWTDDDHVYFSIGNIAPQYSGVNVNYDRAYVIVYTISTGVWALQSYAGQKIYCSKSVTTYNGLISSINTDRSPMNMFITSAWINPTILYYAMTEATFDQENTKTLRDLDTATSSNDGNPPVYVDWQTHWENFDMDVNTNKVQGIAVSAENAVGLTVMYQTDKDSYNNWHTIGTLTESFSNVFKTTEIESASRVKFRVCGPAIGGDVSIGPITFIKVLDLGVPEEGYDYK